MADTIIGVDISIRSTGVAIVSMDHSLVFSRTIVSNIDNSMPYELDIIRRARNTSKVLMGIMDEYAPVGIAFEGLAYGGFGNNHKMAQLCEFTGIVKHAIIRGGIEVRIIAPASLKKFMTGNGRADKKAMIAAVSERLGVTIRSDDIADAAALALYFIDGASAKKIKRKRRPK